MPSGRGTGYLDLSANDEGLKGLTLNGHIGYTHYASDLPNAQTSTSNLGVPNFWDYKAGVTYDLGSGLSGAAALAGANKRGFYGDINESRVILTISKTI